VTIQGSKTTSNSRLLQQYWQNRVQLLDLYEFAVHFFLAAARAQGYICNQTPPERGANSNGIPVCQARWGNGPAPA
jgi:hypothetical protein